MAGGQRPDMSLEWWAQGQQGTVDGCYQSRPSELKYVL